MVSEVRNWLFIGCFLLICSQLTASEGFPYDWVSAEGKFMTFPSKSPGSSIELLFFFRGGKISVKDSAFFSLLQPFYFNIDIGGVLKNWNPKNWNIKNWDINPRILMWNNQLQSIYYRVSIPDLVEFCKRRVVYLQNNPDLFPTIRPVIESEGYDLSQYTIILECVGPSGTIAKRVVIYDTKDDSFERAHQRAFFVPRIRTTQGHTLLSHEGAIRLVIHFYPSVVQLHEQ